MKQVRLLIPVKIGWNLYCHLEVTDVYYKNKKKNVWMAAVKSQAFYSFSITNQLA